MLELHDLSVSYGAIEALRGVSLEVAEGEIVAILGANGAGKTTLMSAVSRLVPVSGGSMHFMGENLSKMRPHEVVRLGISHCPEGRRVFPDLTVAENLDLGAYALAKRGMKSTNCERVFHYFPILADRQRQKGGTLSGGEQQMLALGRSLMSSPRLLMLDEPSLGLAPKVMDQLFDIIQRINREERVTMMLVEQNANEALQFASRAYILEQGRVTLSGPAKTLLHDERVIRAYLGG